MEPDLLLRLGNVVVRNQAQVLEIVELALFAVLNRAELKQQSEVYCSAAQFLSHQFVQLLELKGEAAPAE